MKNNSFIGFVLESKLNQVIVGIKREYHNFVEVGDILMIKASRDVALLVKIYDLSYKSLKYLHSHYDDSEMAKIDQDIITMRGALLGACKPVAVIKNGEIRSLRTPLGVLRKVYFPDPNFLEKLLSSKNSERAIKIGHMFVKAVQFDESSETETVVDRKVTLTVPVDSFFSENVLVLGAYKFGKTTFIKKIVEQLIRVDNISVIIFDINGEYVQYFSEVIKNKEKKNICQVLSLPNLLSLLEIGFGPEYLTKEEIVTSVSFRLEYEEIDILNTALNEIEKQKNPVFSIENISKELEKYRDKFSEKVDKIIMILKDKWGTTLNNVINLNKITIVDFTKETQHISKQIYAVSNFAKLVFNELRRRYKKENIMRVVIIEDIEKFCPKKEYESIESVILSRESILNLMAQSRLLNIGLIVSSSNPSMLHPALFYLARNKVITKFFDDNEKAAIRKTIGIKSRTFDALDIGEFIILGPSFRFSIPINIKIDKAEET